MDTYDPLVAPDPAEWLALSEPDRNALVQAYVDAHESFVEGKPLHVMVHCVIENQAALGEPVPVRQKLRQLMAQGLNRHIAIHAVGMVWAETSFRKSDLLLTGEKLNAKYYNALKRIDVRKWLRRA